MFDDLSKERLALCIPGWVLCVMLQGRVPVSQSNLVLVQVCKIEA